MSDRAIELARAELESAHKDVDELMAEQTYLKEAVTVNKRRQKDAFRRVGECRYALDLLLHEAKK